MLPAARQTAFDWRLSDYLDNPVRIRAIADRLLANRNEPGLEAVRLAVPYLLNFFLPNGGGVAACLPIYQNILLLLATGDRLSAEDWNTAQTLLVAILDAGVDKQVYKETADAVRELWVGNGSAARFNWALDTLDLLAAYPAPEAIARARFFDSVRDSLSKDYRRVKLEHWEIFRWLASDLNREADYKALRREEALPKETTETSFAARLAGKLIGIYTLTESAGARAKAIVEAIFPGVDIKLSHDLLLVKRITLSLQLAARSTQRQSS